MHILLAPFVDVLTRVSTFFLSSLLFHFTGSAPDGLCLNAAGEMFSWGKGERGQLGHERIDAESPKALLIQKAVALGQLADRGAKPSYHTLGRIEQISAGMIHSAALEKETNHVYIWGKNAIPIQPNNNANSSEKGKVASDARLPVRLKGLPDKKVLQIACGSHHTSVLLEDGSVWAVGITTDTKQPVHEPVCLIEAGIVDLSTLTQFAAHMDRTTLVFAGREVLQVHLWQDEENQELAVFTPTWVDELLVSDPDLRIREVHRSWLHTVIITEKD
jgi:alpha-tubulin suppressor-like RCC1 family protein